MVRHQAVCPNLDLVGATPLRHELQVTLVILITKKRLLAAVSPLRDVVRQAWGDNSCESRHERRLSTSRSAVNNCVWCPPNQVARSLREADCDLATQLPMYDICRKLGIAKATDD